MLPPFISDKFRFWSFVSMVLLVFVHSYNLEERYLQPWSLVGDPLTLTSFTEYFLANGILRFRIPMLFLISGYLYALHDQVPNHDRIRKRVRTLLLPYLLWSGLCLLLMFGLEAFTTTRGWIAASHIAQIDETRTLVHEYSVGEVIARWIFAPLPYQLWFIRVLFFYNLAYPLLGRWVTGQLSARVFFSIAVFLWLATAGMYFFEGEGRCFSRSVSGCKKRHLISRSRRAGSILCDGRLCLCAPPRSRPGLRSMALRCSAMACFPA